MGGVKRKATSVSTFILLGLKRVKLKSIGAATVKNSIGGGAQLHLPFERPSKYVARLLQMIFIAGADQRPTIKHRNLVPRE